MRRTSQRRTPRFLWIARFILRFGKTIAKAFTYLMLEFTLYIAIGGLAIALLSLGMSSNVALSLSLVLVIFSLLTTFLAYWQHQIIAKRRTKANSSLLITGEVKLADWIAQTLCAKASQEWEEYQDWLHDILLVRRQLLDSGSSRWKVTLLTYWRLIALCVTVTLIKLRRLVLAARRLR
ncbi:hypothetical protein H6F98_10535 [Microcoleus sp. FACHB-SPT15]|uniref:hypothetical protein n=1 Tax=Microcoleus sp. FACHB-SPT15 TaxID=2692830 RepID=UPI00177EA6B9|nr:hypothetical protein [Microcoleus sp. FACHB-SPT15]MBD1805885.1 hypothetical protein [Microcoleus sp. FACHB-SPT15]